MTGDEALAKLKAIKFRQGTAVRPDTEQDHHESTSDNDRDAHANSPETATITREPEP